MTELDAIARARALLEEPVAIATVPPRPLVAAAFAAMAALALAGAVIVGPGFEIAAPAHAAD